MSEEASSASRLPQPAADTTPAVAPPPAGATQDNEPPDQVFLVAYPKIMFLYPTVITALFCAIFMWAKGVPSEGATYPYAVARIFLVILALNLVLLAFDFPRTTSLTLFFAITALCVALWSLFHLNQGLLPKVLGGILVIEPMANAAFYMVFTVFMLILYGCVLVSRRFDYWEVKGNELLHHHGVLSDLKRFSAPNLRIDKEINDVFEYLLLRSGRLILHPSNERRAIVLENVLFINSKEEKITRMLGALQVRVRTDKSGE